MMADESRFIAADNGTHQGTDPEKQYDLSFRGFGYDTATDIRANMTQSGADVLFVDTLLTSVTDTMIRM